MFLAMRRLCFEDTKEIMSPEIHLKSFGTFEKQAPGEVKQITVILLQVVGYSSLLK